MVTVINELSALTGPELNAAAEQLISLPHGTTAAFANTMTSALTTNTTSYLSGRRNGALNIAHYGAPLGQQSLLAQGPSAGQDVVRDAKAVTPSVQGQTQNKYVTPFGLYFDQDSTEEFAGFNAWSAGVTFGLDEVLDDSWIVGWGGSYMHSWMDFDSSFGDGEIDSFRTGPYASYFNGDYYVDVALGVGYHLNDIDRDIDFGGINRTANADFDSYDFSAYLGGGYDFELDNDWVLTPTASMQYINYRNKSFKESGAGAAGLDVDANTQESFLTKIGVNLQKVAQLDSMLVASELFAGYAHEFIDEESYSSTLIGGATKFSTRIDSERDDIFYFGGNLTGSLTENASVFLRYEGEVYSGNNTHIMSGGFTWLF